MAQNFVSCQLTGATMFLTCGDSLGPVVSLGSHFFKLLMLNMTHLFSGMKHKPLNLPPHIVLLGRFPGREIVA